MRWLLVFLAVATLAVVTSCGGGDDNSTATPSVNGALTFDQVEKMNAIIRADPAVQEIATQSTFTVTDFSPWSAGTQPDNGQKLYIGGVANMVLDHPIGHLELNLRVPSIRSFYASWSAEDRAKYTAYRVTPTKLAVDNFSHLQLSVDLDRGKVAGTKVFPLTQYSQRVAVIPVQPTPQSTSGISQPATDIINAEPRVAAILADKPHKSGNGSTYTIGTHHFAADAYNFDTPQTIEADWTILFEFDQTTGVYESQLLHFKAANVASLSVVVDLDKSAVAWLEPFTQTADATPRININTPTPVTGSAVPTASP